MSVSFRRASFGAAAAVVLAATVAGVLVSGSSGSVAATAGEPAGRTVTVSGAGQASGTPDVVRLDIGVQRTGKDVNAALDAASDDIRRIKEALARHGVKDADIQTSQLSINQHYGPIQTYEGKGGPAPGAPMSEPAVDLPAQDDPAAPGTREGMSSMAPDISVPPMPPMPPAPEGPNGYDVFQSLSVKLRNLDDAGATISDAAAAGGNATRINGVSFEFSDSDALMEDARERAFADAKEKAEQYADLAGGSLGKVVSVSEGSSGGGFPSPVAAQDSAGGKAVPFYPGSQQVEVGATVVWELN